MSHLGNTVKQTISCLFLLDRVAMGPLEKADGIHSHENKDGLRWKYLDQKVAKKGPERRKQLQIIYDREASALS